MIEIIVTGIQIWRIGWMFQLDPSMSGKEGDDIRVLVGCGIIVYNEWSTYTLSPDLWL
jgi:hypothetical protein